MTIDGSSSYVTVISKSNQPEKIRTAQTAKKKTVTTLAVLEIPNHDWGLQHFITFQQDIQHHPTIDYSTNIF